MSDSEKTEVLGFLRGNAMGVISTLHQDTGAPESAVIAFAETSDFQLIFQTFNTARKYKNIYADARISFVTGWETEKSRQITFQYEGLARELDSSTDEYEKYRTIFEQKETPCTSDFLNNPRSRLFVVSPIWFGYSDYRTDIPRVIEYTF